MDALFDFLFSPAGIAAYVAFWAFKLLAGAWIISQMLRLLPVRTRRKTPGEIGPFAPPSALVRPCESAAGDWFRGKRKGGQSPGTHEFPGVTRDKERQKRA